MTYIVKPGPSNQKTNAWDCKTGAAAHIHRNNEELMKNDLAYVSTSHHFGKVTLLFTLSVFTAATAAHATTYFVSNSGNDSNYGTSPSAPWQTLAYVGSKTFAPGDTILLKGGETFAGTLTMNSSGAPHRPITIGSYGNGAATINAGSSDGIDSTNASYVTVHDLTLFGTGGSNAYNFGISFTAASGAQSNIAMHGVTAYGFGIGISVDSSGGTYTGVNLSHIIAYNDNYWGIFVQGYNNNSSPYSNISDVTIDSGTFYGDGNASKGYGAGVLLAAVDGAVVKNSTAYNNGDIGFWCYSSNNIKFTHDSAYGNLASNGDGGFDLDEGTTNSTIEYSYAHDNHGEGFELCALSPAGQNDANLTVRYNISENDHYPIAFGCSPPGGFIGVYIYNNTIYTNRADGLDYWGAFNLWDQPESDIVIANNLVWNANASEYDLQWSAGSPVLNFNAYYGPAFEAYYDGSTYTTFNAFQIATGLEANGLFGINPDFAGTPGVKDPNAYKLSSSSALLNTGTSMKATYGIDPGEHDFYGNELRHGGFSIGAYQSGNHD